ncbi:MAG: FkbM family methyltransferase [Bacteroidales bacterium]|nr:FkbM family methyltransferase [Bacteroidales bacterium]
MNLKSKLKLFYKELIFRLSSSNNLLFTFYYRYLYKPTPQTIDEFANIFSKSRTDITVIQIGANDGINNDPIHKFIKRDKWNGVLLEPQKDVFDKYLQRLYRKTNAIITLNAALDKSDGKKTLYKISACNSRWAHGLASFNRSVLEKSISSGYVARQALKEGCRLPENENDLIAEEQVECISPETLIKRYGIKKIDWLQIDTEGYDFEIIKMFNLPLTKPSVIVYENLHLTEETKEECIRFLNINGYYSKNYGPNTLAMHNPPDYLKRFFN